MREKNLSEKLKLSTVQITSKTGLKIKMHRQGGVQLHAINAFSIKNNRRSSQNG